MFLDPNSTTIEHVLTFYFLIQSSFLSLSSSVVVIFIVVIFFLVNFIVFLLFFIVVFFYRLLDRLKINTALTRLTVSFGRIESGKYKRVHGFGTAQEAAVAHDRSLLKANKSTTLLNFPNMVHNLDVEPERKKQKVRSTNSTGFTGVSKDGTKNQKRNTCRFKSVPFDPNTAAIDTY